EHQLRLAAGLEHERFNVNLAANFVGDMRTMAGQGAFLPEESVDSHVIVDFIASFSLTENLATYVKVDNVLDEIVVAARRPAGVRPGLPRTAYLGLTYRL
ncbi:MAG: TonB-dependent receptor, partial [Woeseiaceae bacterium]